MADKNTTKFYITFDDDCDDAAVAYCIKGKGLLHGKWLALLQLAAAICGEIGTYSQYQPLQLIRMRILDVIDNMDLKDAD